MADKPEIKTDALTSALAACGEETGTFERVAKVTGAGLGSGIVGAAGGAYAGAVVGASKGAVEGAVIGVPFGLGAFVTATAGAVLEGLVDAAIRAVVVGVPATIAGGAVENHLLNNHDAEVKACKTKVTSNKPTGM